ncbi:N-sulfoglucosamine sulfohydrolase [Planctomycetales bacterium 10988]|nr:N-sulfoglucosamine sulfohydrolase [Planctomycetales bacterium 10988]
MNDTRRFRFLGILSVACFLLFASLSSQSTAKAEDETPPSILWITCEDMSPHLGCYGDHTVATPNIDRLAAEGVRYTKAFGTYGVCAPNRHTIIMGMYPVSTGAMAMRTWKRTGALHMIKDPELLAIPTYEATPPAEAHCFPEYLQAAGYYCTNNSKTDYQFDNPIAAWNESSRTAHYRNRPDPDQPFFAVFNNTTTHESGVFKQRSPQVVDPNEVPLPPFYPDTEIVRRDVARHYDNIVAMDEWVGKILKDLEKDGLLEKTIIFFYSDHGDGLPRHKRWVYDSGIHVPLIVRFPHKKEAGTVNDELVSFVDLAPTVLSLAGVDIPKHFQGQAFLGPEKVDPRDYIYACRDRMDPAPETIRAVRDSRYKYIRNYRPDLPYLGFVPYRNQQAIMQEILHMVESGDHQPNMWQFWAEKKPLEELYDTQNDPHEIHNLAADPAHFQKLAELRDAHEAWTKKTGDLGHITEDELIVHLWPPEGKQPTTKPTKFEVTEAADGKFRISLSSKTEGASIAYQLPKEKTWHLYLKPFEVESGTKLKAKAHRLGWKESEETVQSVP